MEGLIDVIDIPVDWLRIAYDRCTSECAEGYENVVHYAKIAESACDYYLQSKNEDGKQLVRYPKELVFGDYSYSSGHLTYNEDHFVYFEYFVDSMCCHDITSTMTFESYCNEVQVCMDRRTRFSPEELLEFIYSQRYQNMGLDPKNSDQLERLLEWAREVTGDESLELPELTYPKGMENEITHHPLYLLMADEEFVEGSPKWYEAQKMLNDGFDMINYLGWRGETFLFGVDEAKNPDEYWKFLMKNGMPFRQLMSGENLFQNVLGYSSEIEEFFVGETDKFYNWFKELVDIDLATGKHLINRLNAEGFNTYYHICSGFIDNEQDTRRRNKLLKFILEKYGDDVKKLPHMYECYCETYKKGKEVTLD